MMPTLRTEITTVRAKIIVSEVALERVGPRNFETSLLELTALSPIPVFFLKEEQNPKITGNDNSSS